LSLLVEITKVVRRGFARSKCGKSIGYGLPTLLGSFWYPASNRREVVTGFESIPIIKGDRSIGYGLLTLPGRFWDSSNNFSREVVTGFADL
jgi:hypothetical protein